VTVPVDGGVLQLVSNVPLLLLSECLCHKVQVLKLLLAPDVLAPPPYHAEYDTQTKKGYYCYGYDRKNKEVLSMVNALAVSAGA
jgi:hypothetical protein